MGTLTKLVGGCLSQAVYVFFLGLFALFTSGGYHWAMKTYRTPPLTINPVMYPTFTEVNVTTFAPHMREHYYKLWRTYDWMADGYAAPRVDGVYTRVPVVYVHGNGGSYYCARSLARFLYESNARLRQRTMRDYRRYVKRQLFREYQANATLPELEEGMQVPAWLQHRVEEQIVREEVPLLGTELFSVDFLEESSTHSASIALKEARFLNHSLHLIVSGFLGTFAEVLAAPPAAVFDVKTLANNNSGAGPTRAADTLTPATTRLLRQVEKEYTASVCSHASLPAGERECQQAKQLVKRFSTLERVRAEVRRVQETGVWIWAESLGGVMALLSAIMAPQLCAGVVMVGTPMHYPPLFFDHASVWLYRVLEASALLRHPAAADVESARASTRDWGALLADARHPAELLYDLHRVPAAELHWRLRKLILLAINGGTLDDVIPSISGYIQRSTPRTPQTAVNRSAVMHVEGGHRRDISTETLRGCGATMDHRGLVYGLQFLQHSADSLVQAALLPNTNAHFGREASLPSAHRDRLFPTVVETLDEHRVGQQREEHRFVASLRDSLAGPYVKETKDRAAAEQLRQLCVDGDVPIDYNDLPLDDEADAASGYYDGGKVLNILLGVTTLAPEQVHLPTIQLFHDQARETPTTALGVSERAATLLHLPTTYKGTTPIPGRTLQTAVSFAVYRRLTKRQHPTLLWPRFCMLVEGGHGMGTTRTYVQYDRIDISQIGDFVNDTRSSVAQRLLPFRRHTTPRVHLRPGYALVRGADSALLEPHLQVDTDPKSEVFPLVMCGSLHSFYLALRGQANLAVDEPEHQLQYFYGPFHGGLHNFTYPWKPFSTFPPQLNETYLIYTVTDNRGARPAVRLPTYSMLQDTSILSPAYLRWAVELWPQRWLAAFSMYTGIARLGGAAVVLFFTLFIVMGMLDDKVCTTDELRAARWRRSPFRRLRVLRPLAGMVVMAFLIEAGTGWWASSALKVCLSSDPPPYVTEAEMTARMSAWEKFTLVVLYGITPRYGACRASWIAMQGAPVWSVFAEQMATVILGFGFSGVFIVIIIGFFAAVSAVTWPLRRLLLQPLLRRAPALLGVVFAALWATPTVMLLTLPTFPLCFVDLVASSLVSVPAWMLPRCARSGWSHRRLLLLLALGATFPTHFNGLVLTIRNIAMLHGKSDALADAERFTPSRPQYIGFALVQGSFACAYVAAFFLLRNEETLRVADSQKRAVKGERSSDAGAAAGDAAPGRAAGYILGDLGRRAPWLRRWTGRLSHFFIFASVWMAVIAMRRPLEDGASLLGNVTLIWFMGMLLLHDL